ncbi:hypothetical protein J3R30DRAFT_1243842 [Lentinula aciculospora]|uniref:3-carboxymuconate cyclase n=1 Tax=Lentinula aciculospora TaxID=153920 RepID=A0A9W8ZYL3_9AGAR|nr:hypothetical protein J3R30DRAFT_1243842 [Lentinula aciculospora]
MKPFTHSIFLALLLAIWVQNISSTITITGHHKGKEKIYFNTTVSASSVGSVYFITNEPTGNHVVAADIGSDGQLILRSAYATGGIGSHVVAAATGATTGPDGLNSQGAISVSVASSMLATVNAGSHTVSLFKIDANDSSNLTLIGEPISSGGHFPTSVAFNNAGDSVCVLNGGSISGVSCFYVNQTFGLEVILETTRYLPLNQTTPATTGAGAVVGQILFSADDTQLLASIKGLIPGPPVVVGYLAIWDIDPSDRSLSEKFIPIPPPLNGNNPFGLTPIEGQNAVIAADTNDGFSIFDLIDGSKSSSVDVNTIGAICWSAYSPKTGNYYMIDAGGAVFEVNIDSNLKGSMVQQYNSTNMVGLFDGEIASLQNNDFLYILAENFSTIEVMSLNAPGKVQQVQSLDVGSALTAAGIPISSSNQGMATFVRAT